MTVKVHVSDDFLVDGIAIWISLEQKDQPRRVLRVDRDQREWEQTEPLATVMPSLKLAGEESRALLDALLRHYEGASDMRTARSDLLHERERADRMQEVLIQLVMRGNK